MPNPRSTFPRCGCRVAVVAWVAAAAFGCVERTLTINTEPQGATVMLNDEEVGKSPVRVPFTWYGDYDIIVRKESRQTVATNQRIRAPWYEWPVFDLFSECLVLYTIHDDRVLDTIVMGPAEMPDKQELILRADEMRARTLTETDAAPK